MRRNFCSGDLNSGHFFGKCAKRIWIWSISFPRLSCFILLLSQEEGLECLSADMRRQLRQWPWNGFGLMASTPSPPTLRQAWGGKSPQAIGYLALRTRFTTALPIAIAESDETTALTSSSKDFLSQGIFKEYEGSDRVGLHLWSTLKLRH